MDLVVTIHFDGYQERAIGTGSPATMNTTGARSKAFPQMAPTDDTVMMVGRTLPRWACMESVTQAKSKIGHALIMILQVGVVEKFRSIPLVTALDLACFGGAVLVLSACIFLLSQLSVGGTTPDR
ncbi:hypothetical protein HYC85_008534 [Camellia sinensis]|uniref:Uncharacterized protein n=1 Tax=Camellia sinensis TaxID=4442 RepID=A0A7J7HUM5_CAMSI|nr:hypothetical protein HYC85_008534 [Camellia sinensis]